MMVRFDGEGGPILVETKLFAPHALSELTLILDTGADMTVIDAKFLKELGLRPQNKLERIRLLTGSGSQLAMKVTVPKLGALGKTRKNMEVACFDMPGSIGADGVLGLDFLRGFELTINFRSGTIRLK